MADKNPIAMTALSVVIEQLASWPAPKLVGNRVIVPTHCLHSSGTVVRVVVEGRSTQFTVHDDGAAIDELSSAGGSIARSAQVLRSHFSGSGIHVTPDGVICSPPVDIAGLAPAIALIANASREGGDLLLSRWKPTIKRNFKKLLQAVIEAEFKEVKHEFRVFGESQKQHKFDFAIQKESGKLLLVDAVPLDANAISSAVIRNLDVRRKEGGDFEVDQRIVYDDSEGWQASDLALLGMAGTRTIPFSRAGEVLGRVAA